MDDVVGHIVVVLSKIDGKPVVAYGTYSDILEARSMASRVGGHYVPVFNFQAPPFKPLSVPVTDASVRQVGRSARGPKDFVKRLLVRGARGK